MYSYISLESGDPTHFFISPLAICISSFEKCLFMFSAHFSLKAFHPPSHGLQASTLPAVGGSHLLPSAWSLHPCMPLTCCTASPLTPTPLALHQNLPFFSRTCYESLLHLLPLLPSMTGTRPAPNTRPNKCEGLQTCFLEKGGDGTARCGPGAPGV